MYFYRDFTVMLFIKRLNMYKWIQQLIYYEKFEDYLINMGEKFIDNKL